jgi:hypothetical protein
MSRYRPAAPEGWCARPLVCWRLNDSRGRPAVAMVCLFQIGWRRGDYDAQVKTNRLYRLSMTLPGSEIAPGAVSCG